MKTLKYIPCFVAALVASPLALAATAPTVVCSGDQILISPATNMVEAVVNATVQDLDGDALMVEFNVNGHLAASTVLAAVETTNATTLFLTNTFTFGTNTVQVRVSDDLGSNWVSCSSLVVVASNSVPMVTCSEPQELDCIASGMVAITGATIFEPDGDALNIEWVVNGQSFSTNTIPADGATNPVTLFLTNTYPVGTNLVTIFVTDEQSNVVECTTQIIMQDTNAPVIRSLKASKEVLWPPNHKLVSVSLSLTADDCSPVTWRIIRIKSSEPCLGPGSGHTGTDYSIKGPHQALLRAERSGKGPGRVYTITVEAADTSGNTSLATVRVLVPHDQSALKSNHPAAAKKPAAVTATKVSVTTSQDDGKGKESGKDKANSNNKGGKKK